MVLTHRKQPPKEKDVEEEAEVQHEDVDRYSKGGEYEILLRYVADEAEKDKSKKDKGDDSDSDVEDKRLWYAPWRKVKVQSDKEKKVPQDWLKTDFDKGLSDGDIEGRRKDFGYNELTSPKENQLLKFISYFRGPILYSMEAAVVLSAGLQDWIDFGVIIAILMMNALVGWYQEKQAGDIVEQLKAGIAMKATVVRNGKESQIEARELVIGDIVILSEGETIPADSIILADYSQKGKGISTKDDHGSDRTHLDESPDQSQDKKAETKDDDNQQDHEDKGPSILSVDQSAITGESLAVDKYVNEIAYYTCGVKRGRVYGMVSCSAKQSFVGKTATLVMNSNEKGHFQIVLGGIGTSLLVMVIGFIFVVWIGGFFRGLGIATPKEDNLLVYALVFLIIGVPVGLPCVTTTTMAVGAAYLARRNCIVQKLTAIESLAGVDVLCTDKTGTLTANKLSLNKPYLAEGVDADWFMTVAILASSHNIKTLDPIDKVTVLSLKDYPGAQENLKSGWKTSQFYPFDPVSKRITSEVEKDGKKYTCAKGAPNAVLKLKKFDKLVEDNYRAKSQEFANRGFRSLGVAVKEDGRDWELLGIMSMSDPPRSDTAATIRDAQDLGIKIKMLTGDAVNIGVELARQLGLGTRIFDSEKLISGSGMTGAEVRDFVEAADGFGEVFPEHKNVELSSSFWYQVVQLLQERGHLVAMTGDGVNDAPSLKRADCGIAVEGASDAARSAAAVVFLDEGLGSIITSFKVARQIFHRLKAYVIYRIALCIHLEVYLMLSILILNESIRVDLVVFLAIFADIATIAIAYDKAPIARGPVEWQLPKVWVMSTVLGLILAAGTWIARGTMFLSSGGIIENFGSVQEVLFLEVALTESWLILITRMKQTPDEAVVLPSWQLVGAVFGVDVLATLFCVFGWLSGSGYPEPTFRSGRTSIVAVVRVWGFSFGVLVVTAFFYLLLNQWNWLNSLGKPSRSKKNEKLENFLEEMKRMTLKHEKDSEGEDVYRFAAGTSSTNSAAQDSDQGGKKGKRETSVNGQNDKKDDGKEKQGKDEVKKEENGRGQGETKK